MCIILFLYFFFFFSSRRRHTRSLCDWSSDVCSSDLDQISEGESHQHPQQALGFLHLQVQAAQPQVAFPIAKTLLDLHALPIRSEERRVGKECRSKWARKHATKRRTSRMKVGQIVKEREEETMQM